MRLKKFKWTCCYSKLAYLLHMEKYKTTVQKQKTQNKSSNMEWRYSRFSDIQDYNKYIMKKCEKLLTNPPIHIYINRINNRLVFKIKDVYKLELQTPETMKLFGSTKKINRQNKKQKQPSRGVLRKSYSENMHHICRRTPMLKRDTWVYSCKFAAYFQRTF